MLKFRVVIGTLLLAFAVAGCSSHNEGISDAARRQILYSPNGEPLTGGPLNHPSCQEALAGWFARVDTDHDGMIDRAEFFADTRDQFGRMDLNHDGIITSATLSVYRRPYQDPRPTVRRPDYYQSEHSAKDEKPVPPPTRRQVLDLEDPVMTADRKLTFQVTLPDFQAQAEEIFSALDTDHLGTLSLAKIQLRCQGRK